MKNKKLRGFTLVELIVVMAIFGIIMFAALQLMLPVGNQFRSTAEYEGARASIDNIKRYLDGSLRYADRVVICVGDDYMDANGDIDETIIKNQVGIFAERFTTSVHSGINDSNSNPTDIDINVIAVSNTNNGTPNVVGTDGTTNIDIYGNTGGTGSVMTGGIISKYVFKPNTDWSSSISGSGTSAMVTVTPSYEQYAVNEGLYSDYGFNIYLGSYEYVKDTTGDTQLLTPMDYNTTLSSSNVSFTIDVFKKWQGNYKTLQQSTTLSLGLVNIIDSPNDWITVKKYKTNGGVNIALTANDIGHNDENPLVTGDVYGVHDPDKVEEIYTVEDLGTRFNVKQNDISGNPTQINDNFFIIYTTPKRASDIV
ncbi:MAG: type II secretion system protein [Oscillospiraceae bacterium]